MRDSKKSRDFSEEGSLVTTFWSRNDYESRWKESLGALVYGLVDRCILITHIINPKYDHFVNYWSLYKEGETVYVHGMISVDQSLEMLTQPPSVVAGYILQRKEGTPEEQAEVEEWEFPFSDVVQFVEERYGKRFGS
ncbi:MAG: hypothetical protein V4505_00640 [Pseudomonadota bacterium]